jgi:hypothetical protein
VGELEGIPGREGLEKPYNCAGLLRLSASSWDRGLEIDHVVWGKGMMMAIYPGPPKYASCRPVRHQYACISVRPPFFTNGGGGGETDFPPHRR